MDNELILVLLALACCAVLTVCSGDEGSDSNSDTDTDTDTDTDSDSDLIPNYGGAGGSCGCSEAGSKAGQISLLKALLNLVY